ncbi:MAG: amino acid permease, partial [Cyanobacteria bacterium]|nr:amino acid permease [Cyanobacteriota bacterium]
MTFEKFKRMLVGCPLETHREKHERLIIPLALAVFASDALSSTAYATEEILKAFIEEGMKDIGNLLSIPVSLAIVLLIIIVVTSYRQVIRAYPQGGGAYIVAKECLGPISSQIAGSALLIDYILTVAVSICAGIEALTSTGYVDKEYATPIALFCLIIIMFINLRGVRESGKFLAFPAY